MRDGSYQDAEKILKKYSVTTGLGEEDSAALFARIEKEKAFNATSAAAIKRHARLSAEKYRAIYQATGGTYTGINAAPMMRFAADEEECRRLAAAVLEQLPHQKATGYWDWATRAEASALLCRFDDARQDLSKACGQHDADAGSIGTTRRQFRRLAELGNEQGWRDLLHAIRLPDIIMIPALAGTTLSHQDDIANHLASTSIGALWLAGLSTKAEIALAETCLERGIEVNAVLAIPHNKRRLVEVKAELGRDWAARLGAVVPSINLRSVSDDAPTDDQREHWIRHAKRQALGSAMLAAAAQERFCFMMGKDGLLNMVNQEMPDWAGATAMSAGWNAVLTTDISLAGMATGAPGLLDCCQVDGMLIARVDTVTNALNLSFRLSDAATRMDQSLLTYCDLVTCDEPTTVERFPNRLKLVASQQIYASASFAAETAILSLPDVQLRTAGKAGGKNQPSSIWSVTRVGNTDQD